VGNDGADAALVVVVLIVVVAVVVLLVLVALIVLTVVAVALDVHFVAVAITVGCSERGRDVYVAEGRVLLVTDQTPPHRTPFVGLLLALFHKVAIWCHYGLTIVLL
jgi:hypothetical protein